jgi:hypothetical protein
LRACFACLLLLSAAAWPICSSNSDGSFRLSIVSGPHFHPYLSIVRESGLVAMPARSTKKSHRVWLPGSIRSRLMCDHASNESQKHLKCPGIEFKWRGYQ